MKTTRIRTGITLRALLPGLVLISPQLVLAQASPFMTGATALQTNILFCPKGSHLAIYDDQKVYMSGVIQFFLDVDSGRF